MADTSSCCCCYAFYVLLAFIAYKVVDRFIRQYRIDSISTKSFFISGCDHGFGFELAKKLDSLGCTVFAGCLTEKGETELSKVTSNRLVTVPLDLGNKDSIAKAAEIVKNKLPKGNGLYGLMNNAGILGPAGRIEWLNSEDFNSVMKINLYGMIDLTNALLPLIKKEKGRIVIMSSVYGLVSLETATPYSVSKFAVEGFADALRRSMRIFGVKVLMVEPGIHRTPMAKKSNMVASIESSWKQASADVKAEFGQEYFDYIAGKHLDAFDMLGSDRLRDVIDAIENAFFSSYPRARYPVGKDAKFLWCPLHYVPEWLSDLILEKADFSRPTPAALK